MSRYGRKQGRNPLGEEQANPVRRGKDRITPMDTFRTKVQSGPVRTWAEMTPEQRQRVLASIKPPG